MEKPNFTGTWKFNPGKSLLQIPAPDSTIFVVEHTEPSFRLSRTHVVGGKSDTFTIDLITDGKDVATVLGDLRVRARAYWEGDTLVFDSRVIRGKEEGHNVVRYKFVDTLDSFVGEERLRSKSLNYDNLWVLDRQYSIKRDSHPCQQSLDHRSFFPHLIASVFRKESSWVSSAERNHSLTPPQRRILPTRIRSRARPLRARTADTTNSIKAWHYSTRRG